MIYIYKVKILPLYYYADLITWSYLEWRHQNEENSHYYRCVRVYETAAAGAGWMG